MGIKTTDEPSRGARISLNTKYLLKALFIESLDKGRYSSESGEMKTLPNN